MTADYLQTAAQAQNCAAYSPFLSYVYPKGDQFQTWHAQCASVKTVIYTDMSMPNVNGAGVSEVGVGYLTGAYSCAAAKTSSGAYVRTYNGTGYLFDPHGSCATKYAQAVIDYHYDTIKAENGGVGPDAMFADNYNDQIGENAAPKTFTTMADWTSKLNTAVAPVNTHGAQLFPNTLGIQSISNQLNGITPSNVTGGEYENCFVKGPSAWSNVEEGQIASVKAGKVFWCYTNGAWSAGDGSAYTAQRLYYYASFLLTYDLGKSIYQTWFNTASGFRVMPETGFVPTKPAYAISNVSSLQFSGGAYARDYGACYYRGKSLGACRIVVNPGSAPVPVKYVSNFHHAMVLHGSDVLDGGSASFDGQVETTLAPGTAEIVVQ